MERLDVRLELQRLGEHLASHHKNTYYRKNNAESVFFQHLLRQPQNRNDLRDALVAIRAVEVFYRSLDRRQEADLVDTCLEHLEESPDMTRMDKILVLLARLARRPGTCPQQETSTVAKQLLALRGVANRENRLMGVEDAKQPVVVGGLDRKDGDLAVFHSCVPLQARDIIQNKENRLHTVRFTYGVRRKATALDEHLLPAERKDCVSKQAFSEYDLPSMEATSFWMRSDHSSGFFDQKETSRNSNKPDTLFGALVHPRRKQCPIDGRLSFPDLFREYGGFAPDLLDQVMKRKQDEFVTAMETSGVDGSLLSPIEDLEYLDDMKQGSDLWIQAASARDETPALHFGWEEEVKQCYMYTKPTKESEKESQYLEHGLLASERGVDWYERKKQTIVHGEQETFDPVVVKDHQLLIRDCMFACIGVPSQTFLDEDLKATRCRIAGVGEQTIRSILALAGNCGRVFNKLVGLYLTQDSILNRLFEIGPALKEAISNVLLQHQKTVTRLFTDNIRSMLQIPGHVEPLMVRLESVFEVFETPVSAHRESIALLTRLHGTSLKTGITSPSPQRLMLEGSMEPLVRMIHSWMFQCTDASEHFQGPFLDVVQAGFNTHDSKALERAIFHGSIGQLPFQVHLPPFVRSSLREKTAEQIALLIVRCGCILRILRNRAAAQKTFEICVSKLGGGNLLFLPPNPMRPYGFRDVDETTRAVIQRKNSLWEVLTTLSREAIEKKKQLEDEELRKLMEEAESSRLRSKKIFDQHQERLAQDLKQRQEKSRLAFEELHQQAEAAKRRQQEERERERKDDLERMPQDLTTLVTDQEREEAEMFLMDQYRSVLQEQGIEGEELEKRLEEYGSSGKQEVLSTRVMQDPGGKTSITSALQFKDDTEAHAAVKVLQVPGGKSSIIFGDEGGDEQQQQQQSRPQVKVLKPPGDTETENNSKSPSASIKISKPPGGEDSLSPSLVKIDQDEPQASLKVKQSPGGLDSVSLEWFGEQEELLPVQSPMENEQQQEQEDVIPSHPKPSIKINQMPGGKSSLGEWLNQEEQVIPPIVKQRPVVVQETEEHRSSIRIVPGGQRESTVFQEPEPWTKNAVTISQAPGGKSQLGEIMSPTTAEPQATTSVRVRHAPGGASTIESFLYPQQIKKTVPLISKENAKRQDGWAQKLPIASQTVVAREGVEGILRLCRQQLPDVFTDCDGTNDDDAEEEEKETCAPFDVVLEMGLVEPILDQCEIVELGLVQALLSHSNLLNHLEGIKSYMLLGKGDLFDQIVQQMYVIRSERKDFVSGKGRLLKQVLISELSSVGLQSCPYGDLFSYGLWNPKIDTDPFERFETFSFLKADYELTWPLVALVSPKDLDIYRKLHQMIMRVKYCNQLVKMLWKRVCGNRSKWGMLMSWLGPRWHQVRHLLGNYEGYILTQILDEFWTEMVHDFQTNMESVVSIQRTHHTFIKKAERCCFLDGSRSSEVIFQAIDKVLNGTVEMFEQSIRAMKQDRLTHALQRSWNEYARTQKFLLNTVMTVAEGNHGAISQVANNLLLHINFNEFFQI